MPRRDEVKPETWAIIGGRPAPMPGATLNTAIVAASTYVLGGQRIYSRNEATEGWESFEALLGGLEGGEAVAFSSGMAACAALLGAAVTADAGEVRRLRAARSLNGATPGMLECFLALRGARTLPLRLRHAQTSAQQLAARLADHAAVRRVRYPGSGTIVSFELADAAAADRVCRATRIIRHATSLGGVETTMERRSAHPGQEHIPPGLIRLSVGCEDPEDLWRDLDAALGAT